VKALRPPSPRPKFLAAGPLPIFRQTPIIFYFYYRTGGGTRSVQPPDIPHGSTARPSSPKSELAEVSAFERPRASPPAPRAFRFNCQRTCPRRHEWQHDRVAREQTRAKIPNQLGLFLLFRFPLSTINSQLRANSGLPPARPTPEPSANPRHLSNLFALKDTSFLNCPIKSLVGMLTQASATKRATLCDLTI
jgi:hypothetical protein